MTKITENTIEEFAIELLERLGYKSRRDETFVTKKSNATPNSVGARHRE